MLAPYFPTRCSLWQPILSDVFLSRLHDLLHARSVLTSRDRDEVAVSDYCIPRVLRLFTPRLQVDLLLLQVVLLIQTDLCLSFLRPRSQLCLRFLFASFLVLSLGLLLLI